MIDLAFRVPHRGRAALPMLSAAALIATALAQAPGQPAEQLLAAQPVQFVENRGQWDEAARFLLAANGGGKAWVTADGVTLQAERGELGAVVRLRFEGAERAAEPTLVGLEPGNAQRHWLRGDAEPVRGVRAFARVVGRELYPAIDWVLRQQDGRIEYDLLCRAGADLDAICVGVAGHGGLRLLADGSLAIDTVLGELRQTPPVTWVTTANGERQPRASRFVLRGDDRFGFAVDGWDASAGELTIDPGLQWGTFLGGAAIDRCTAVAVDSAGSVVVVGASSSTNLPTTVGAYRTTRVGATDAFVAKIASTGALQFCSYVGGTFDDAATAVQILSGDRIVVAGTTASVNFPITGHRLQNLNGGGVDLFVIGLDPTGATLTYGTYFGGTGDETDVRMRVQPNENIWLAGRCTGSFPTTTNAFQLQSNSSGNGELFFCVFDRTVASTTTLLYSTYFGGTGDELAVDSLHVAANQFGQEIAVVGLTTNSTDCPTTVGTYQAAPVGPLPTGFFAEFDPLQPVGSQSLLYASYFGAAGGTTRDVRVARDSADLLSFAVTTASSSWATTGVAFQRIYGGGASDVLCGRFDPSRGAGALVLATYYGGSGDEVVTALDYVYQTGTLDLATFAGSTTSTNLPVTPSALQSAMSGTGRSGFAAQFDYRLFLTFQLRYGSYFDGCGVGDDVIRGIVRRPGGELAVAGETTSAMVPARSGTAQSLPGGGTDGFAAYLDTIAQPAAFTSIGVGCGLPGDVPVLSAGQPPRICRQFDVNLTNLQPNGGGFMVLGFSDQFWLGAVPLPRDLAVHDMPGCTQYIDTDQLFLHVYSGTSTTWGMLVPPAVEFYGIDFYLQFLMADARVNALGLVTTNAAKLNIRY